jgi:hypothetical protein
MSNSRNKTHRRVSFDVSGADYSVNESLENMLNSEASSAFKRPWHRLDRGLRLNRIRLFTEAMGKARGLKETEQIALMTLLTRALDRKVLNSKTCVVYDIEKEEITEIKPLIMHQNAQGEVLFQIMDRGRGGVTFRKRVAAEPEAATAAATAVA